MDLIVCFEVLFVHLYKSMSNGRYSIYWPASQKNMYGFVRVH